MSAATNLFWGARRRKPQMVRAEGVYLWDSDGKRYIDGSSGPMTCNIGHGNPGVLQAMRDQMQNATFGMRLHFETNPAETLATRLAQIAPGDLSQVFFTSGGSEAVDSALKLARAYALAIGEAQRWKVISRFPGYHGCTFGALSVTGYAPMTAPFDPMLVQMPKIPAPRAYLDGLNPEDEVTGHHYADMLEQRILAEGPETVLGFIHEPIGGASTGALVPPEGYMVRIREICDRYGVLLIHDEVISGGGRVGTFFAGDLWGVVPDLITLSKGFGAGYMPLGAVIAREPVAEAVLDAANYLHGFTYGGNPLACAAGLAVLDEIERHGMMDNAVAIGTLLRKRLEALMQRYEIIGDVRGQGLLQAFELVSDRETMAPLPKDLNAYDALVEAAYAEGLIIYARRSRGGLEGDHFLVAPPMITTEAQVDEIMEKLDTTLSGFIAKNRL
ncbi:MAG: aspartate aminotransferase family protein [Rhodobacter sp.]|nr:aspartate aminotransferase family protein [Rhodobacter sp.]